MVTPEHHVALVDHLGQHSQPVRRIWPVRLRAPAKRWLQTWGGTVDATLIDPTGAT